MPSTTTGQREITLLQERSAGTFAQVYLAHSTDGGGLSRFVAVKVLKERWTKTSDIIDRTRDEAQLLASLQHQNIVRVDAVTEIDGRTAIIMEFVHGLDLAQLLQALNERNLRIPPRALFEIAEGIASALAAAWFKVPIGRSEPLRVVHRDIKPSNVMISTEGELRVLDFGTARFEDASRQASTQAFRFGSMKYMSPERRAGSRGEHAADLYSLGLMLIELLGRKIAEPLPTDPDQHERAVLQFIDAVPDFGLPNEGWDNSLRETLTRLCAADPSDRLDARQTVKLMRAFKEQASGSGLLAFAEDVVAPMTHAINAIPDLTHQQPNTNAGRFMLDADGRTSVLNRMPHSGGLSELPTQVGGSGAGIQAELPTMVRSTPPTEDEPTQTGPLETEEIPTQFGDAQLQRPAPQDGHLPPDDDSSHWVPRAQQRPANTGPVATPGQAKRLPPAKSPTRPRNALALGCGIMVILLVALGLGGWLTWVIMGDEAPDRSPPTAERQSTAVPANSLSTENPVQVSLHSGDPTVQWIRLEDATGTRLINARPDGEATVAPGTHTISVKVTARNKLSGEISINKDTSLTCKPATMGRVRCIDPKGKTQVLLQPSN